MSGVTSARWLTPRQRGFSIGRSVMRSRSWSGAGFDGEAEELALGGDGLRRRVGGVCRRLGVAAPEVRPADPRLEGGLVAPAGVHVPGVAGVGGAQELELLETVLLVDGA